MNVDKDQFCINAKPQPEEILLGKKNELINAVVYLKPALGAKVEVNPKYEEALKKQVKLDNNGCMFHPRVFAARVGQELRITNSDPVGHNTNIVHLGFNQMVAKDAPNKVKVSKPSNVPVPIVCSIHPLDEVVHGLPGSSLHGGNR